VRFSLKQHFGAPDMEGEELESQVFGNELSFPFRADIPDKKI